jgi:hypothetical protein
LISGKKIGGEREMKEKRKEKMIHLTRIPGVEPGAVEKQVTSEK